LHPAFASFFSSSFVFDFIALPKTMSAVVKEDQGTNVKLSRAKKARAPPTAGAGKKISKSSLASLTFPVGRVRRYMKEGGYSSRVSESAAVYLTSILEYLAAEVLELAGNAAKEYKQQRIKPRYIQYAIRNDEELDTLLHDVTIRDGGVMPHIEEALLQTGKGGEKSGKDGKKSSDTSTPKVKDATDSQEF